MSRLSVRSRFQIDILSASFRLNIYFTGCKKITAIVRDCSHVAVILL